MSRNGSGTYSLPAGNPVVTGTTISSTWANSTLTDLATAMTGSLASDGQTTATGNLNMGTNKITNIANGTLATDVPSLAQVTSTVAITGGTIDGTPIGATTPSTGSFTNLVVGQYILESITVVGSAPSATTNYDVTTQSVLYYTSNATTNFTLNVRASSTVALNTLMATGQSLTIALFVTDGATGYYPNVLQIDGSTVTPKWQNGSTPSAGFTNAVNIYTLNIVKTGNAAFTAFASQTKFA
jgi:hypothetical protein